MSAMNDAAVPEMPQPGWLDRAMRALTQLLAGRMDGDVPVRPASPSSP